MRSLFLVKKTGLICNNIFAADADVRPPVWPFAHAASFCGPSACFAMAHFSNKNGFRVIHENLFVADQDSSGPEKNKQTVEPMCFLHTPFQGQSVHLL